VFYRSSVDPFLKLGQIKDHQLLDLHSAIMVKTKIGQIKNHQLLTRVRVSEAVSER
jgi:hypothetical protein